MHVIFIYVVLNDITHKYFFLYQIEKNTFEIQNIRLEFRYQKDFPDIMVIKQHTTKFCGIFSLDFLYF